MVWGRLGYKYFSVFYWSYLIVCLFQGQFWRVYYIKIMYDILLFFFLVFQNRLNLLIRIECLCGFVGFSIYFMSNYCLLGIVLDRNREDSDKQNEVRI